MELDDILVLPTGSLGGVGPVAKQMPQSPISEKIAPVISAVAERIHYAESRRANYSTMGGVLLAAAIAIFTFSWGAIDQLALRWAGSAGAIAMFMVGAATVWLYGRQTNRYPFTSATKTWKWFYRDALPSADDFKIPWSSYLAGPWKNIQAKVKAQYSSQLPIFEGNISQLSSNSVDEKQDVEQLYVLHVNELYKNQHLSHIRTLFNRGLVAIVLTFILGAGLGWFLDIRARAPREFCDIKPGYSTVTTMRLLGSPLASEAQVAVKIDVVNHSDAPMSIQSLKVYDKQGWPIAVTLAKETRRIVHAKSSLQYFEIARVSASSLPDVHRVEIDLN